MNHTSADKEDSVKSLYQNKTVAKKYIENRFQHSWSFHLHQRQVAILNHLIASHRPAQVLELAPGPARVTTDLKEVRKGLMVEASPQMIDQAVKRLKETGLEQIWEVKNGNAFDLSFIQRCFDLIYTFRFIRHFKLEERRRLYKEIFHHLNPGGYFVLDIVNKITRDRLDVKTKPHKGEALPVYDMTYHNEEEIKDEFSSNGFELISIYPVLNYFSSQSTLSYKLDDLIPGPVIWMVRMMDYIPSKHPLEWVAVFRKQTKKII